MDLLPKVFRSEGDIVNFDPSKILDSIIKETGMKEEAAKKITELVVRRIVSSGIKFLSGPHIREIVCSILSEQHFENERKLYTRIGMALMDYEENVNKAIKKNSKEIINPEKIYHWAANQIAKEYAHLRILNSEESQAHLYGDIYIHDLEFFISKPFSQIWDPRLILKNGIPPVPYYLKEYVLPPAKNLKAALNHLSRWLLLIQNEICSRQGFSSLTTFLAPYIKGLTNAQIFRLIKYFIYEINQIPAISSQEISSITVSSSPLIFKNLLKTSAINPYGKSKGYYEDFTEECFNLFNIISSIFKQGNNNGNPFDFPLHEIYIQKKWLDNFDCYSNVLEEIEIMKTPYLINLHSNIYNKKLRNLISKDSYSNFGKLQDITLNLPRYAYEGKDESTFMEILRKRIDLCIKILYKKFNIISDRLNSNQLPLCGGKIEDKTIYTLENQILSISFVGLNEAIKFLTNFEFHENDTSFSLGKKILNEMKKICEEKHKVENILVNLCENKSQIPLFRFAELDLKHFNKVAIAQSNDSGVYYTNSAHFNESIEIDIFEKIKKQGEIHSLIQDRVVEYFSLSKLQKNDLSVKELIDKICSTSKISCFKFYS